MTQKTLKAKIKKAKAKKPASLRKRAEGVLAKQKSRLQKLSSTNLKKLVHELGTHQIELEMQNEELRNSHMELESLSARYADLYDFSPVGYFSFDEHGVVKEVNLTGAKMLGITKPLLLNKPILSSIAPAHRTIFSNHLKEVFRTGTRTSCEIALVKKDGSSFQAQLISISFDKGAESSGVCRTAVSDITERTLAEALRENEEQFRRAVEEAPIPVIMQAEDGQVLQISRSWTELTGYTLKDVPTFDAWLNTAYGDGAEAVRNYVRETFKKSRRTLGIEFPVRARDGRIRHWRFSASSPGALRDGRRFVVGMAFDITDRRKAEEVQGRLAAIVESAEDAIIGKDLNGIIQTWNAGAENIFGYKAEEVIGKPISLLVPPGRSDEIPGILKRLAHGEHIESFETVRRRKDGTIIPVSLTFSAVKDADGKVIGASKIAHDISGRRRAEEALRESEKRYRSLFENMLNGFAYCKMLFEDDQPRDFIYLEVNDSFEKLTGLANVVGKKVSDVIPGIRESHPELFEIYGRVAMTGRPESFEIYLEPLATLLSVSVYSTDKGYFVAVFDNITERKRAESITQARLRMVSMAASPDLSRDEALQMMLDELEKQTGSTIGFYHFLDVDQETLSLQAWSTNTLLHLCTAEGKGSHYNISRAGVWVDCVRERRPVIHNDYASLALRKGLPPEHAAVIREMVVPILRGGRIVAIIGVGNKPTDYNATDLEVIQSLGQLSWEIFERIKAVDELQIAHAEVEQRSRELAAANKELEAFTYSVSHDLRAPLRTVSGFAKAVVEDYGDKVDAQCRDYLVRIYNGSEKMTRLIDDLLRLSRISRQELARGRVDLHLVVSSILAELRQAAPERDVQLEIMEGVTAIADHGLMKIALDNLLGNAWKFTSKAEKARIEFGSMENKGKTVYYIRDNGAGFDPANADRMFQPFQRLHSEKEFEGTGIGLAIVERVIRRHAGKVWAEGEVGKGATVYFTLG